MGSVASVPNESMCDRLTGLIGRQIRICKKNLEVMGSVSSGAQRAIEECQYQFQTRRWNCSTLGDARVFGTVISGGKSLWWGWKVEVDHHFSYMDLPSFFLSLTQCFTSFSVSLPESLPRFLYTHPLTTSTFFQLVKLPIVLKGTREAAFVHALSAAGVAHAVTRACSSGEMEKCGCDRTVRGQSQQGFQWSGCSDNVGYGTAFSRAFVDVRDKKASKTNPRSLMNLHNNEAGRKVRKKNHTHQN